MTASVNIESKRAHAVAHFGCAIVIAIPVIGTVFGLIAMALCAVQIFVKSDNRLRDFAFLIAYPIVFICVFGIVGWIAGFFVGANSFEAMFAGCAATVPVSFYFIHTISGRVGEY